MSGPVFARGLLAARAARLLDGGATCRQTAVTAARSSSSSADADYRPTTSQADTLMDIGTRDLFTPEHDSLRASCRKFFSQELKPFFTEWEKAGQVPRELWLKLGEQGMLGMAVPSEYGGSGAGILEQIIVVEEMCYNNTVHAGFGMHSDIVVPYMLRYGTPDQITKFVPEMVQGRKIGALAMTEPGAGSDVRGMKTHAVRDGDDWVLNGSKTYITNGILCDVVVVAAITDKEAKNKAHGISLFLVEADMAGFKKGRKLDKMGLKASDTAELFFEDVRLPASSLLGMKENQGFYQLMKDLKYERLIVGAGCSAWMEWMFEETRAYVKDRKAFGKTVINFQTVQHKLAEMKTSICLNRAFTDQCIDLQHQNKLDDSMASMLKYWSSDLLNKVAYDGVQLHGGSGFMLEYPIARAYADARVQPIYAGTNEIMKELIARKIVA